MAISQSEQDKFPGGRIKYFIHRVKYPYLYEFFSIFLFNISHFTMEKCFQMRFVVCEGQLRVRDICKMLTWFIGA